MPRTCFNFRIRPILVCMVALTATMAEARLGDKEAELVARFGPVQSRSVERKSFQGRIYVVGQVLGFRMEQWSIAVLMIDDRCAQIDYGKTGDWTEEQVATVL